MNLIDLENSQASFGKNYYQILGCDQNSSIEQICTEYKLKALTLHPDKNHNKNTCDEFKQLQEAKETLMDPKMRHKYDTWLNSGIQMKWHDWLNFTNKNQTVFHWVISKSDLMLKPMNENNIQSQTEFTSNNYHFNEASCNNDILRKFRNYQI